MAEANITTATQGKTRDSPVDNRGKTGVAGGGKNTGVISFREGGTRTRSATNTLIPTQECASLEGILAPRQ